MQNSYLNQLNLTKERVSNLQLKLATQSKINKPSDAPLGSARVLRINSQLESINSYLSNIGHATSFARLVNEFSTAIND